MTFQEAVKILNIEDHAERIWNSNSHGELFHVYDYVRWAENLQGKDVLKRFRPLFLECVRFAEENWERPESVFQHMPEMMKDLIGILRYENSTQAKTASG